MSFDNSIKDIISEYLLTHIGEEQVNRWIKPINTLRVDTDIVTFIVPNKLYKNMIENSYKDIIESCFQEIGLSAKEVRIVLAKDIPSEILSDENDNTIKEPTTDTSENMSKKAVLDQTKSSIVQVSTNRRDLSPSRLAGLNEEYTFNNFVPGPSNEFVYTNCLSVAKGNFHIYNPLFIYGSVGLGKTHLMHAVGNHILLNMPKLRIVAISGEQFTTEVVSASRNSSFEAFNAKYRDIDLFLFDDIQFLSGKAKTVETFFSLFNGLYDAQKQIIITSDKEPKHLDGFEERLKSRFSWGLSIEIEMPSEDEIVEIIRCRSKNKDISIDEDTSIYIAQNIKFSNIREIIGTIIKLQAFSSFQNKPINRDLVDNVFQDLIFAKEENIKPYLSTEKVIEAVCDYYNVKFKELKSSTRKQSISVPRQVCMYILRSVQKMPFNDIGQLFGGKNHSTAMHSVKKIEYALENDIEIQAAIKTITSKLGL